MSTLHRLLENERVNAAAAWTLVVALLLAVPVSAIRGSLLWAAFAAITVTVALVPAALSRNPTVMASWEVLLLATAPVVGRSVGLLAETATYVAVAALALLIAVEIDAFSSAAMTPRFAVGFVVLTTMAIAGVWAIAQFASDAVLSTGFLEGVNDLMWDLVLATAVGLGAGVLFELYVRRYETESPSAARWEGESP